MPFCRYELGPFSSSFMLWPVQNRKCGLQCLCISSILCRFFFFSYLLSNKKIRWSLGHKLLITLIPKTRSLVNSPIFYPFAKIISPSISGSVITDLVRFEILAGESLDWTVWQRFINHVNFLASVFQLSTRSTIWKRFLLHSRVHDFNNL